MHHYLTQLLHDLEAIAANPPALDWFETPPHLANDRAMAELAMVPAKPISKWTGISREAFPDVSALVSGQYEKLNEAIFKVYNALNLNLIDCPENLPPEVLYKALTGNWDLPVQYMPSWGVDVALCAHDPQTCHYGDYCKTCDLPPLPKQEFLWGLYDDDGKKIEPESVPIPSLCLICKSYDAEDWEENLLCLMNRNDQKNKEEFECGAFEKS